MDNTRKTYIENNNEQESLVAYLSTLGNILLPSETIATKDALGRITACPVFAKVCDPTYNAAAMDGVALHSKATADASEKYPLFIPNGKFRYINTGNELPKEADSVIMIEDVIQAEGGITIVAPSYPWQYVRVVGESIVAGEMLLPSGHRLRAVDLAALTASGNTDIKVQAKPKVGIIPTGSEMVESPQLLAPGKLMESNSKMFSGLITDYGGDPKVYPTVADRQDALLQAVQSAIEASDILLINAGSSAGTKDFTFKVIEKLGKVVVHGIAIRPGKPTILGIIGGKPVIGLPGYPVSAWLSFELFVKPILYAMQDKSPPVSPFVQATLTKRITSTFKNTEYLRMSIGAIGDKMVATPLAREASAIMSLVRADGLLQVPQNIEGIEAGEKVSIQLLKSLEEIKKTLVIIGSHDLIIDLISDKMKVTSAHVGSLGGLFALMRKEAHIAPIHLLDEQTGKYNISYVAKYMPQNAALIKGVGRKQGFIVRKGDTVAGFKDIAERKLRFANRQRGAGTRLLLDFTLKQEGIDSQTIFGYEKEYTTHLAVASAVKNNVADVGLGVLSAANALDMQFIPFAEEEYDFLVAKESLALPMVIEFIDILKSVILRTELDRLGGYTYNRMGEIQIINGR